jgi:cephalosporin-C deacetylase-like acetyl esterase
MAERALNIGLAVAGFAKAGSSEIHGRAEARGRAIPDTGATLNRASFSCVFLLVLVSGRVLALAGELPMATDMVKVLAAVDSDVFSADERARRASMLSDDADARLREANRRDARQWANVRSKADWEKFRDVRLQALRASLGTFPLPPKTLRVEATATLNGSGFTIENLVFESRPGLIVTANLYVPDPARPKMPGILICHSHHNPKTQEELQDMGVNWARQGCLVLVMDQVGHGERRQQPYGGREDYRSRYTLGMQLHLAGESLMGWMAWDLMRGVDLLLSRPGMDREKIIVLGSVAGGGDPAAVAAAIDPRITGVAAFNFGGPQPETRYPLPADAETAFNYIGSGSFESTRNLRRSACDGFLPYAIVAATAPRPLIYAHEFAWDGERDPVWKRFQTIYGFYGAADRLAVVHGWGAVTLKPPEASHCNNIGPAHRKEIYPLLERWFGIPAPKEEWRERRKPEELLCLTDDARSKHRPQPVHELAKALGLERAGAARAALSNLGPPDRRRRLREDWARLLGEVEPKAVPKADVRAKTDLAGVAVERILLTVENEIAVPTLLLLPAARGGRAPVVVGVAQEGKKGFLVHRGAEVAGLLQHGVAVCLPDVRGTGETDPGGDPGRHRNTVALSSTDLMLGQTMLGSRLRDLGGVMRYLATRPELDATRLALWGDSFAPVNVDPFRDPPQDSDDAPREAQPVGGLLALFGALYEEDVRAVAVRRGLVGFGAVLDAPFCYVPHDTIVPGALTAGDLCDVAAALVPRPVRLEGLVGGRNCVVEEPPLRRALEPALAAYRDHPDRLVLTAGMTGETAAWLAAALKP